MRGSNASRYLHVHSHSLQFVPLHASPNCPVNAGIHAAAAATPTFA
jgi:hypothetical protein